MITIYKYEISPPELATCRTYIDLPEFAGILCVGTQVLLNRDKIKKSRPEPEGLEERLFLWAQVNNDDLRTKRRELLVVGTGHEIDAAVHTNQYKYIGTAFFKTSRLVFHVYERSME